MPHGCIFWFIWINGLIIAESNTSCYSFTQCNKKVMVQNILTHDKCKYCLLGGNGGCVSVAWPAVCRLVCNGFTRTCINQSTRLKHDINHKCHLWCNCHVACCWQRPVSMLLLLLLLQHIRFITLHSVISTLLLVKHGFISQKKM